MAKRRYAIQNIVAVVGLERIGDGCGCREKAERTSSCTS